MKILINESVMLHRELERFANEILEACAEENESIFEDIEDEVDELYVGRVNISERNVKLGNYRNDIIRKIIKQNLIISFLDKRSYGQIYNGTFYRGKFPETLHINLNPVSLNLKEMLEYLYKENDGDLDVLESFSGFNPPLYTAFKTAFHTTLVHELRHLYDAFISNNLNSKDKKSRNYYKNLYDKNTREAFREYYNLPHEYWARYSEFTASVINKRFDRISFQELYTQFKKEFVFWSGFKKDNAEEGSGMEEDAKRRLRKALYKFYIEKRDLDKELWEA